MAKIVAKVYSEFCWVWSYPCSPERHCLFLWKFGLERVCSKNVVKLLASQSKWNHPERVAKKAYTKQFKLSTQSHRGNSSNLPGLWSIPRMGRYTLWSTVLFSLLLPISGSWAVISWFSFLEAISLFSYCEEGWKVSLWPVSTLHHFCHYWEFKWYLANLKILFLPSGPQCNPEFF